MRYRSSRVYKGDLSYDEYNDRLSEEADRMYDEICCGDRSCVVCNEPSYTLFGHDILCFKCYQARREYNARVQRVS
jgi:hypothetical protein